MISSKYLVLDKIIKAGEGYISGQEIAAELGLSRSGVNKAVNSLKAEGYEIEAINRKGYRIITDPDLINYGELLSFLPEERIAKIAIFDELVSTNVTLHELAELGSEEGQCVIASSQSRGRGRDGGRFDSPDNKSIYMSYLFRPEGKTDLKKVTPFVADIVAECLRENLEDERLQIKSPGDIYLGGKKICGILSEVLMEAESDYIRYLMTGIGIRPVKGIKRARLAAEIINKLDRNSF